MKQYTTYICAIVLMLGFSVSAWGTSCDLKIWDKSTSAYITWKTIDESYTFGSETYPYYDDGGAYHTVICWTPSTYSGGYPSGDTYYYNQQYGTRGTPSTLYAVYQDGATYTSAPDFQVGFCDYTLSDPSSLSSDTRFDDSGTEKVKLSWSCGSDITTHGTYLKFECGAYGESATYSYSTVGTDKTSWKQTRTSFSNGKYWWSIQALGDGDDYCNSSTKMDYFCVDDVDQSTPSGLLASSVTVNSATISWSAMSDAEGYIITVKKKSDGSKVSGFDEKDVSGTSVSVTGLSSGVTYVVELYAYNACSDFSETNDDLEFTTLVEYNITLDGNGGSDGIAGVYTNATSLHDITAPTKTGYNLEGYYTTDECATKIATSAGALVANITVSSDAWTDGDGKWILGNDATFFAKWEAKECTVTLLKNNSDASGSNNGTAVVSYDATSLTSISAATRTGYHVTGYWEGASTGNQVLDTDGKFHASAVTGWITSSKWSKDATSANLYARWEANTHTLEVAKVDNVTVTATPSGSSALAEEADPVNVSYGTTVTLNYSSITGNRNWAGWKVYMTGDASTTVSVSGTGDGATFTMPDYDVTVSANLFGDFVFSCAELTLTPHLVTASTPIFITSAANKKVRSQDYIEITGNGLTPSTELTFPGLPSKFEIKNADGTAISTEADGTIEVNAYIFYTPGEGDTSDDLDKLTGITVSVGGAKPKTVVLEQEIYGRHLPADFVIAAKNTSNNKWYALPANMDGTGNPTPVEIAVDDINNPSIAYTAASNIYNLYLSADKEKVQLGMKNNVNGSSKSFALWANNSVSSTDIGKNSGLAESSLGDNYKWTLTQKATSITNSQDAKYTISNPNNANPLKAWFAAGGGPKWGLYSAGETSLRLIPASDITFAEASVVEWGQHGAIIEVDATAASGIDATSVIAHLGEATSSAITLVQTKAGDTKNNSSKYNYTVNFGDGIDFAAAASNGAMLTLEWKKGETVKAMSNVIVPKIVASTKVIVNKTNYPTKSVWDTEVHVLPGDTLEIDADYDKKVVTISELNIYPGATVKIVGSADTLNVRSLVLRNGWTRVGSKRYDVARLYVGTSSYLKKANNKDGWYSDWYIDYDQYYPIAVPFPVDTTGICYKNSSSKAYKGVRLRYYSGELRATNIQQNQDANWVEYTWGIGGTMPATLEPSKGYIMTAKRPTGKAFSIVRMPLTFSNDWTALGEKGEVSGTHKDQVTVTAWGDASTPEYAKGWNIIANPYMSLHEGALRYNDDSGEEIEFANIPDINFKEYDQLPIDATKLKPSSAFLVQAPKDGTVTFGTANRKAAAPSYRQNMQAETYPRQKAYIVLASEDAEDMMGIWISDKYSAEYEINADLEKLMGDGKSLRTYMHWNEMKMAYLAINKELAQQYIPVSVRIEKEGEHTFSIHSASIVGDLKAVYLTDYKTGQVTNLLEDSYPFYSTAGTINNRFAINAIVGPRDLPTELDIVRDGNDGTGPIKFIYHDKVFILHEGVIYDSTGKRVREIKK